MTQQSKNLRLRPMQTLLREALIALIEERGFEALTIGEITERADKQNEYEGQSGKQG